MSVMYKKILFAFIILGLSGGHVMAQNAQPPARVEVARATIKNLAPLVTVPGTVISRNDSRIAAEVAGRVVWIAEVGDEVAEGDIIARIDDREWRLQLRETEARVKQLEASQKFLGQEVQRFEELASTNNTPRRSLEQAISQRDMTEQDLIQARVALERTQYNLSRTEIRAPFPGRVVERLVQVGEYPSPGTELARLVDTVHIEVRAQVPLSIAPFLVSGLSVQLESNGRAVLSPIRAMIPVGDEVTRTMQVRVELTDPSWIIGTAVKVGFPSAEPKRVVTVPRDALVLRADNTYVFKVNGEIAERVAVRTGAASGNDIEVLGPIADGDMVVIRGAERLREGQTVALASTT